MNDTRLLQISYWLGAVGDFAYAAIALIPSRVGVDSYVYPMGLFAAVAFSWGVMLVMATRKPLERRWVLIPTILVVFILVIVNVCSYLGDSVDLKVVLPRVLLGLGIFVFMSYTYFKTRKR